MDREFIKTLSEDEQQRLLDLSKYANYIPLDFHTAAALEEKASKLRKKLEILTEQERPQSTEQEEKMVHYWEGELDRFIQTDPSEKELQTTLNQIEDKFRRAQEEYNRSKATVEARLTAHKEKRLSKEAYYTKRLETAKQTLQGIRSYRSKPRIKLEMELEEPVSRLAHNEIGIQKDKEYQMMIKDLNARATLWRRQYYERLEKEQEAKAAVPIKEIATAPKVKRKAKTVDKAVARDYPLEPIMVTVYHYKNPSYDHLTSDIPTRMFMRPWSPISVMA